MSRHGACNHRHPEDRAGAAQSGGRRPRRQRRQAAQGARARRRPRAPTSSCSPSCSSPAIRPRTWCASRPLPPRRTPGRRGARRGHGRRRPRRARRHDLARGRQALQRGGRCWTVAASRACASRSTCPTTACSTRSACSTSGRCPGRSASAACASACRSARTSGGEEVCECLQETGVGDADLAQRLAVRLAQARSAHERCGGARDRDRPAAALSQPDRRPGRAGVRRRLVRAERRPEPGRADAGLGRGRRRSSSCGARRRLALPAGRARRPRGA